MKKNKGFTLIELLAVIIVLAIIALIATPIVMNTIKNSKKNSALISGEAYIKQVGTTIMEDRLKNGKFINDGTYIINSDGNLTGNGLEEPFEIPMSGKKPSSGTITIKNGQVEEDLLYMIIDNYEVEYDENDSNYIASEFDILQPDYLNAVVGDKDLKKTLELELAYSNVDLEYELGNISEEEAMKIVEELEEYAKNSVGISSYLGGPITRGKIDSIEFMTSSEVPSDAIGSWVASRRGEVMAWYKDEDNNGLYEVYIGQDGGVKANPNSSLLFAGLTNLKSLDLTNLDTSNVTDMSFMFAGCGYDYGQPVLELNLSAFDTSKVTNMQGMFFDIVVAELDLRSFDTSKVTDMSFMFGVDDYIEKITFGEKFDTRNVTNMAGMFGGCNGLTTLNISSFNTSKVTDMSYMFRDCSSLTSLNLSSFDTRNVTDMSGMFAITYEGSGVKELDLSSFDTSNVTKMPGMFIGNESLESITFGKKFDTMKVTNMRGMFYRCDSLTELDLRTFSFERAEKYDSMFYSKIENITVKDDAAKSFIEGRLSASNITGVTVEVSQ